MCLYSSRVLSCHLCLSCHLMHLWRARWARPQASWARAPAKWPGTFFKKHVPGNITCPKWTIQAFPRFLVKNCKYHPSSSNDYHCENRTEILCKYPCRIARDLFPRPDIFGNFWNNRTLDISCRWKTYLFILFIVFAVTVLFLIYRCLLVFYSFLQNLSQQAVGSGPQIIFV